MIGTVRRTLTGLPSTFVGSYSHCRAAAIAASSSPATLRSTLVDGDLAPPVDDDVEDHDPADALGERLRRVDGLDVLRLLRNRHALAPGREHLFLRAERGRSAEGDQQRQDQRPGLRGVS